MLATETLMCVAVMLAGWHVNVSWLTTDLPPISHSLTPWRLTDYIYHPRPHSTSRELCSIPFFPSLSFSPSVSLSPRSLSISLGRPVFVFLPLRLLRFHQRVHHVGVLRTPSFA